MNTLFVCRRKHAAIEIGSGFYPHPFFSAGQVIYLEVRESMTHVHCCMGRFLVTEVEMHLNGLLIDGAWMQNTMAGTGSVVVYVEPADVQAIGYVDGFDEEAKSS